jgi:cell wall-associated NlpC family hydrolase
MNRRGLFLSFGLLLLTACSTPRPPASSAPRAVENRHDVVILAMAMLDRNYTYGGKKLHTGFDCSGLVSFVYRESVGMSLKGSSADMARQTRAVDASQVQPGDLVFFNTLGSSYSHVGIYIGSGQFIHAENEKTGVKTSNLKSSYWARRFEGYRSVF